MRTNPIAYPDVGRVTVCTTATRPTGTRRYEGKVIWDTDVDALLVYTGGSWTSLNGPRGSMGYASKVSSQTGVTTAGADVTSLSVTFTAVAGRSYRVSAMQRVTQQTSAGIVTMRLHNGAGTQLAAWQQTLQAAEVATSIILARFSPGAGSTTYKLNLITSAGTVDANASSTAPGFILVEDIG